MNCTKKSLGLILFLSIVSAYGQGEISTDKMAIQNVLKTMFDGMREGDSAKVASVFRDDVRMYTSFKKKTGEQVILEERLNSFLLAVGKPHDEIWNEKINNTIIQIDGGIAQVWTTYKFYIDQKFSHCGIDAFQLVRENDEWKIVSLMDTRKVQGCETN